MTRGLVAVGALLAGACVAWLAAGADSSAGRATEPHAPAAARARDTVQSPRAAELPGRIVFVSERDDNREIYRLVPATGSLERLTVDEQADYPVGARPGGGLLAVRASDPEAEVHVEQLQLLTGGEAVPVGAPGKRVRNPVWLGDALIFEASYDGFSDLYRLRLDGARAAGSPERLTDAPEGSFEPAVEPGGAAIAFVSSRGGDAEIYRLELGDRSLSRLTWSRGEDTRPTYAPDGRRIAFLSSRTGIPTVYLMDPNGAHPRPLRPPVAGSIGQEEPTFSPDGSLLAYVEQQRGRAGLRVVRIPGGELVASSDGDWIDQMPAFSPDGRYLAFSSSRDGDTELYAMATDGGPATRLTRAPGADWLPRWLP
jgi:Tol biopolymer transport system component